MRVQNARGHSFSGLDYAVDCSTDRAQFPVWPAPLRVSGGLNGVYVYGPRAFPTSSFNGSNYWVDVLFRTSAVPAADGPTEADYYTLP
jgi:hypothetical protein